jgi:hypothetical protein
MHMNTLSSKLSAFAAALTLNALIMAGVVSLFALQAPTNLNAASLAWQAAIQQWLS